MHINYIRSDFMTGQVFGSLDILDLLSDLLDLTLHINDKSCDAKVLCF